MLHDLFFALTEYQFLQNAVIASILASIVCGLIGIIIIEKKIVMMSGGIAHTAYGGVGLGYLLGFEPILGAMIFSVTAALGIGYINRKGSVHTDTIIALFWSLGMALGIAFIGMMPNYPPDMSSYLFGNILSVTRSDLHMIILLTILVTVLVLALFNDWKSYLFDSEFAQIIGLRTTFLEYLLLILVALTVVVLIRVVGIILVLALLTAPAASAGLITNNFRRRMLYAILWGVVFCLSGLCLSYVFDIPSGATIIIISVLSYGIILAFTKLLLNRNKIT